MTQDIDDFIESLTQENGEFFALHAECETRYWVGCLSGEAAAEELLPRWFNELRGVEVIGRFVERVPDLTLKVLVGRQVGDEAKHALYCRHRIEQLGGSVLDYRPTPAQMALGDYLDSLAYPEEFFAAQQFTVEAQSLKRDEEVLDGFDPATAEMFRRHINPDEKFHVRLGLLGLRTFARSSAAQRRARAAARGARELHVHLMRSHREAMEKRGLPGGAP
ncbi:hypothetical protein [Paludibacterium yongneupense]|uniref:hypothetical protein n=1 Tax=Paludibacterium yongneupense TaxID=400061 RepID=UPI00040438EC|nr:hypothetical protein [Paludibacterium yongneupense]